MVSTGLWQEMAIVWLLLLVLGGCATDPHPIVIDFQPVCPEVSNGLVIEFDRGADFAHLLQEPIVTSVSELRDRMQWHSCPDVPGDVVQILFEGHEIVVIRNE